MERLAVPLNLLEVPPKESTRSRRPLGTRRQRSLEAKVPVGYVQFRPKKDQFQLEEMEIRSGRILFWTDLSLHRPASGQ